MAKKQSGVNKGKIIQSFQQSDKDTGSPRVQIALLTARINNLANHLKTHRQDKHSRAGLLKLVGTRRRLINFVESTEGQDAVTQVKRDVGMAA